MTQMRRTLLLTTLLGMLTASALAQAPLPGGPTPEPVPAPHFPSPLYTFLWRNWNAVDVERLAQIVEATPDQIRALAEAMGLPPAAPVSEDMKRRNYLSLVRRNWHLLPYEQLLPLVDMTAEQLAFVLREEDFFYAKLGLLKPKCARIVYQAPDAATKARLAEIKGWVHETFGDELKQPGEPRFAFVEEFREAKPGIELRPIDKSVFKVKYIYSYFALYGDALLQPELDPFPDGLLQRLAAQGVDGVWLHVVLRQLAPGGPDFPEFGDDHEKRIENLKKMVARAKRFGIDIYLYMNEPRSMPNAFFQNRPEMAGVVENEFTAMCTSNPKVRAWMSDALAYVFSNVPDLGGVFTISASENLTHCGSHVVLGTPNRCPHCQGRSEEELVAEVNTAIADGVHRGNPEAKVIVWDWAWKGNQCTPETIARLPKSAWLQSVSEWDVPFERGGRQEKVGEYSISVVGPGPRAQQQWKSAREAGLKTVAKVQFNNTWELSTVPYIPTMDLVAQHAHNLASSGVDGLMLSWSLGGYPSPNLDIAARFSRKPVPTVAEALDAAAVDRFGPEAAPHARQAWSQMSQAFQEYPFNIAVIYNAPHHVGAANLLYATPTGYHATMTGIPYDDFPAWHCSYAAEPFTEQFEKMAEKWKPALAELEKVVALTPAEKRADAQSELRVATACYLHFRSVANQCRFVMARDALAKLEPASESAQAKKRELAAVVEDELAVARQMFTLCNADARLGFEAANHYFYLPLDFAEKVINCKSLLKQYTVEAKK